LPRPFFLILAASTVVILAAGACGDDGDNGGEESDSAGALKVVSTVAPITSIAENIGGTKIELEGVVPEGTNSHTFEPPPSVVSTLSDADLTILNGLQLEEPTLELAEANKKEDAVILNFGDETLTPEEYQYNFSFPEEDGRPNPHLWPNPQLTTNYATLIHEQLVELDPDNADYYDANYEALKDNLERLDRQMAIATQTVAEENRKLLTCHDSWADWAPLFGFEVIGAIQPSDFAEPSASEVATSSTSSTRRRSRRSLAPRYSAVTCSRPSLPSPAPNTSTTCVTTTSRGSRGTTSTPTSA
jgi:ABC-type Zn uptake system ZnuABC Zn-binding protein ZnuA